MKKYLLSLFLASLAVSASSTTWIVTNMGFTFTPASLTIMEGDTVEFVIASEHTVLQVSMTTWDANGTTPLPGGFSLPFGGGILLPEDLPLGTHFYVCQPHGSMGMKGMIHVETTTSTSEERSNAAMMIYPNPSTGLIHLSMNGTASMDKSELAVYDVQGNRVQVAGFMDGHVTKLDLTDAAKGIYFIRFRYKNELLTRKIITY